MKELIDELISLLSDIGVTPPARFESDILSFTEFFIETSKSLNLTAIKEPREIVIKHYYDSLYPLSLGLLPQSCRAVDIGCGGGFPSMPIKLARRDIEMLQLDSLQKRLNFLDAAAKRLSLSGISTLHARAEEAARLSEYRDGFDAALSRAVAPLDKLCEYCLPYVRPGGIFIAYKGGDCKDELDAAQNAIRALSARLLRVEKYDLPYDMGARTLVILQKTSPTHPRYPRPQKQIAKSPIK